MRYTIDGKKYLIVKIIRKVLIIIIIVIRMMEITLIIRNIH